MSGTHSQGVLRRRLIAALVVGVVLVAGLVSGLTAFGGGGTGARSAARTPPGSAPRAGSPGPAARPSSLPAGRPASPGAPTSVSTTVPTPALVNLTANGPHGVTSSTMAAENAKPGTAAWRLGPQPAGGFIQGFADTTYAQAGQAVGLYVSTSAPAFVVQTYRMGWYGGAGGRLIWASTPTPGSRQPGCPVDHRTNTVSCANWSKSVSMPVTADFVQGDYLLKLVASSGQQSYVLLTVWDPNSTAAYLVMARSLTENGWNTYGGYDFYQGTGPCILGQTGPYPPCNRARALSFDRPSDAGYIASDFLSNEFPLVQLLEKDGLDAAYCTDITADEHPAILTAHRAVLSLGHDETWTYKELRGAQVAYEHGVNFFFGAATLVRHARLEPSPLGPDRLEVDYRDYTEDPLYRAGTDPMDVTGNTWNAPPVNWSQVPFTGQQYSGYLNGVYSEPFVVTDAAGWIYQGTGLHDGSALPGVIQSDIDHLAPGGGSPANLDVFGHSPVSLAHAYTNQGSWGGHTYSDMSYYTDARTGAGVLDAGTTNWINALTPCGPGQAGCAAPAVTAITENILRVFGAGPAGRTEPSTGNWRAITPSGS